MKIAFLIPTLHKGGAEKIASELSLWMPKKWEIVFILFEKKINYPYRGKVISLDLPLEKNFFKDIYNFFLRIFKLRKIIKEENIDVVISFDDYANTLNSFVGRRPILTVHKPIQIADIYKDPLRRVLSKTLRKFYARACRVIAVSRGIREDLIEYAGINENKVIVINNPYNIAEIRRRAKKESKIKVSKEYIVNIGRAEKEKGQWHLIRVFSKVHRSYPKLKLVIIGGGSLSAYIKQLITELNLVDNIIYVDKFLDNIAPILRGAKIFILSSIFEGFPNVIIESFSVGLPVISTNCRTGPAEIFEADMINKNGIIITKYGILVPPLDGVFKKYNEPLTAAESKLADAIILLLSDDKLRKKMAKYAKKRAEDFDVAIIIKRYIKLINDVFNEY
ncbi:MAG: glycosyltransferase [Candidatus Bilamarchaeaceae archaeon]